MRSFVRAALAVAILLLLLPEAPRVSAEGPRNKEIVTAESLLGEWWGEVTSNSYSWRVYLTLKSVQDGNKLHGVAYVVAPTTGSGTAYANRDHPIIAVLDEDRLSFAIQNGPEFSLTISGKTMTGTTRGIRISAPVALTKVK